MSGRHWVRNAGSAQVLELGGQLREMLVLFDVDGTLLDGGRVIVDTMEQAFLAAGETPPDPEAVKGIIGLSLPEMVDKLAAHLPRDLRNKILAGYRFRYFDAIERQDEAPVFPGAETAILRLRRHGIPLGITTGKSRRSLTHMLDTMGWHHHFRTLQCAEDNPSKPDRTMVWKAMFDADRRARHTILVGDSRYDMRMAANAGIRAIGVSWGYNPPEELLAEGAIGIARDFDHLTEMLLTLAGSWAEALEA
ncbi:MAG: HAD-IA family hydrolase [Pseudomonadota bacterium]